MESVFRYIEVINNGRFSKFIKIPSFSEYFQKLDAEDNADLDIFEWKFDLRIWFKAHL